MSLAEAMRMRAQVHARIDGPGRATPLEPAAAMQEKRAAIDRQNAPHSAVHETNAGKTGSPLNLQDEAAPFSEPKMPKDEAAPFSEPKMQTTTGLTGRTVLLHSDDLAPYQQQLADYESEYKPVGLREREFVQSRR